MYKVWVVTFDQGSVIDESGPFDTRDGAINTADEYAASDRDENVTGLGYEVLLPKSERISRVVYWTAHVGDGAVDTGVGEPPWHD